MDLKQEEGRLLELYARSLQAHLDQDGMTFLAEYAPHWYDVRNGALRRRSKAEASPEMEAYFKATRFHDLTELSPPVVHVSPDARMAWVIGQIQVRASQTRSDGTEREVSFRCAWVSIYERPEADWMQVVNASSFVFDPEDR
jgi:hypothetical protein